MGGVRVGGDRVSGNLLDGVTSVIQFDDISAMTVLCLCTGSWQYPLFQQGTMDTANTSVQSESCLGPHSNTVSLQVPGAHCVHPNWHWCSEQAGLLPGKSARRHSPFKRLLSLPLLQPPSRSLKMGQPHVLAPSYPLLLQGNFLDFSLVMACSRSQVIFPYCLLLIFVRTLIWRLEG